MRSCSTNRRPRYPVCLPSMAFRAALTFARIAGCAECRRFQSSKARGSASSCRAIPRTSGSRRSRGIGTSRRRCATMCGWSSPTPAIRLPASPIRACPATCDTDIAPSSRPMAGWWPLPGMTWRRLFLPISMSARRCAPKPSRGRRTRFCAAFGTRACGCIAARRWKRRRLRR